MFYEPRGSVWRRWDMHVHTPASVLTNFGNRRDHTTWSQYAHALLTAAREREIYAICLSDYFTIDGYVELISRGIYDPDRLLWRAGGDEQSLVVLPGVELRLSQLTDENHAINLHIVFDPTRLSAERLKRDFFGNLPLDPAHGDQRLRATREHLLALGLATRDGSRPNLNEDLTQRPEAEQDGLFAAALLVASVSMTELEKTLDELSKGVAGGRAFLVAVAASGHGGLHELPWEGRAGSIRQSVLWHADFVFSSSRRDRDFLLGCLPDTPPDECVRRFRTLKPCVWGSDAKNLDNLLHPSGGETLRYTWIKADLSFEGLKQLLYEPDDRVAVQDDAPEVRPHTSIIDSFRFLDDSGNGLAAEDWVPLSSGLTTVIGGKSSGKSLLLHLLAKTIDAQQVRDRHEGSDAPYDLLEQDLSFEVRWKNGDVQTLGGAEIAPSRITYLPQNYINRLAEPESQQQLEDVIIRLLKEDETFAAAERAMRSEVEQARAVIASQIQKIFEIRRQIQSVSERIADLGNAVAIEAEINRLEKEQDEMRRAAGMTEHEELRFAELRRERASADEIQQQLKSNDSILHDFGESVQQLGNRIAIEIADYLVEAAATGSNGGTISADSPGSDEPADPRQDATGRVRQIAARLQELTEAAFATAGSEVQEARNLIEDARLANQADVARLDAELEPFQAKLQSRARVNALAEAQAKQRKNLVEIQDEEKRRARLNTRLSEAIRRVVQSYKEIQSAFQHLITEHLSGGTTEIAPDVRLLARTDFDARAFTAHLLEGLDGRQRFDALHGMESLSDEYSFPGLDEHCENVTRLLTDIAAPDEVRTLKLKKSYSPQDVATALVRDHFQLRLSLEHAGDDLRRMSPGKRGMILLRLLLERSDAAHPILIDQPEDNLDNRTVFSQLRHAVRQRKKHRQIIIVSHNANLVVSTDAECVLVAHQYGPGEIPEGVPRFEYRGGALEHSYRNVDEPSVLARQGTREHVCEVLEGGEEAFRNRQQKYEFMFT